MFVMSAIAAPTNTATPTVTGEFADGGTLSADIGTWTAGSDVSYAYQWQDCTAYSTTVLGDRPAAYWRLDEAANPDGAPTAALDVTAAHFNGTYENYPTLQLAGGLAGDTDQAVSFNGSNQYVSLSGTYPTNRAAVSLEVWFDPARLPAGHVSLLGYGDTTSGDQHQFFLGTDGANAEVRYGTLAFHGTTTLVVGQWYHLVAVDTGTTLQLFVNGVLDGSATPSSSFQEANGQAQIGRFTPGADTGTYAKGTVDEAAIYPSALSAAQVSTHYQAGSAASGVNCQNVGGATDQLYQPAGSDTGKRIRVQVTATDSTGSTAAVSPATLVAGGGPVSLAAPVITGTAEEGQSLMATEGVWSGLSLLSQPTYQWQRCGYQAAVLADHPLSYFRLDEPAGTTAADRGSLGVAGTYVGFPAQGQTGALTADPDTSVAFSGSNQDVSFVGSYPTGRQSATVEGWVKLSAGAAGGGVGGYGGAGSLSSLGLEVSGSPLKAVVYDSNTYPGATTLTAGEWYYLAAVDDGTHLLLYVNGKLDGTFTPLGSYSKGSSVGLIGGIPGNAPSYLNGSVDDFAIYGTALSADQIATHYQAGVQERAGYGCQDIPGASGT